MQSRIHIGLLALLVFARAASAQGGDGDDARTAEVRRQFESGMAHFNLQEYDAAIHDFEAGYRLKPDPVFLYNLAQAHRLAGHRERALYFYRAYLRAQPDSPERGEVEGRIHDLQAQVDAQPKPMTAPPTSTTKQKASIKQPTPAPANLVTATAPPPPQHKPIYKRWWLWTAVGVAAAGMAVGVAVAVIPKNAPIPGGTDGNAPIMFH
jgi:hypothetical protein